MAATMPKTPNALLYLALTRTPTHVGCGQGLDDIDLPLKRNVVTGLPEWPGSGIKGVWREHAPAQWGLSPNLVTQLFGPTRDMAALHAGMLMPQDAHLLALPVASQCGGWGWATSVAVLQRMRREALALGLQGLPDLPERLVEPDGKSQQAAYLPACSPLRLPAEAGALVVLGELALSVSVQDAAAQDLCAQWGQWLAKAACPGDEEAWRQHMARRLVVVDDDSFEHLARMHLEVRSRVSLGEGRVADEHALWREECLPADTVMWGLVAAQRVPQHGLEEAHALAHVKACRMQLGGKASVGYGWVEFWPQDAAPTAQTEGGKL